MNTLDRAASSHHTLFAEYFTTAMRFSYLHSTLNKSAIFLTFFSAIAASAAALGQPANLANTLLGSVWCSSNMKLEFLQFESDSVSLKFVPQLPATTTPPDVLPLVSAQTYQVVRRNGPLIFLSSSVPVGYTPTPPPLPKGPVASAIYEILALRVNQSDLQLWATTFLSIPDQLPVIADVHRDNITSKPSTKYSKCGG